MFAQRQTSFGSPSNPTNQRDHIVAQREDGAGVDRVLLDEAHHVGERDADVGVEEVAHGHRAVRAHLDPRLRDDAELSVAEEHALEVVVAFLHADDLAGRRDDLELHRLIGGAAVARRVDVDAADAERAADGGEHVERRARVVEAARAQRFGDLVPRHAGLDPRGAAVALEQPVHALEIEEDAARGDRLAFGRQPAAAAGDGHAVALRHAGARRPRLRASGRGRPSPGSRRRPGRRRCGSRRARRDRCGGAREKNYVPVTDAMLRNPDPGDWLMIRRNYQALELQPAHPDHARQREGSASSRGSGR